MCSVWNVCSFRYVQAGLLMTSEAWNFCDLEKLHYCDLVRISFHKVQHWLYVGQLHLNDGSTSWTKSSRYAFKVGKIFNSGSHFDHVVDVEREVLDEVAHPALQLFHLVPFGKVQNLIKFLQGLFLKLNVLLVVKANKVKLSIDII